MEAFDPAINFADLTRASLDNYLLKRPELSKSQVESASKDVDADSKNQNSITSATTIDKPSFGWSSYAERVNGRFAMIGFIAILLIEAFSGNTFIHWAGL